VHLHRLAPTELGVDIVALALSAIVNIWATGMIVRRAWYVLPHSRMGVQMTVDVQALPPGNPPLS
jgi:hypothetical protein